MLIRTENKLINLDNIDYIKAIAIGKVGDPALIICIGEEEIEVNFAELKKALNALDEIQTAYLNDVMIFDLRSDGASK